jgi:hypothetical protein
VGSVCICDMRGCCEREMNGSCGWSRQCNGRDIVDPACCIVCIIDGEAEVAVDVIYS